MDSFKKFQPLANNDWYTVLVVKGGTKRVIGVVKDQKTLILQAGHETLATQLFDPIKITAEEAKKLLKKELDDLNLLVRNVTDKTANDMLVGTKSFFDEYFPQA